MTELGETRRRAPEKGGAKGGNPAARFFGSIGLFVRQILDELRKVVRPTKSELWQYTIVVIVFVTLMIAVVSIFDFGFSHLVNWVFGGS